MNHLIAIGGHTGTGKSTLGFALVRNCPSLRGALVLDFDQVHREMMGYDLALTMGPEDYTDEVIARVKAHKATLVRDALREGRDVIDASGFFEPPSQADVEALAKETGASFIGLWLVLSKREQERRIEKRLVERASGQPLCVEAGHASDACLGVIEKFGDIGQPVSKKWHVLDASPPLDELVVGVKSILCGKID